MSLTEIMSGAGLSAYAQVALVLFIIAFGLIVWQVFTPSRAAEWRRAARLPLDEDLSPTPPPSGRGE